MKIYDETLDAPDDFNPDNPVMFAAYLERVHTAVATAVKAGNVPVVVHCRYDADEAFWKLDAIFPLAGDMLHLESGTPKSRDEAVDLLRALVQTYMQTVGWIGQDGKNRLF